MSTFLTLPNILPKWSSFSVAVTCPSCGDSRGHAGIFTVDDETLSVKGVGNGFCLKCNNRFTNLDPKQSYKQLYKQAKHPDWIFNNPKLPVDFHASNLNEDYLRVKTTIEYRVSDAPGKTKNILNSRGFSEGLSEALLKRGFSYHRKLEAYETAETMYTLHPATAAATLIREKSNTNPSTVHELANIPMSGLLMPVYHSDDIVGYHIRNENNDSDVRFMPLAHYARNLGKKQRLARHMAKATYITKVPDSITDATAPEMLVKLNMKSSDLLLTEGIIKAEVAHYHLGCNVIGALGVANLTQERVRDLLRLNMDKQIIIAPDADYRTNQSVAYSYVQLADWLNQDLFKFEILEWGHHDPVINKTLKGIDDALLQNSRDGKVHFTRIPMAAFLLRMERRARYRFKHNTVSKTLKLKPGSIIDEVTVDLLKGLVIKEDSSILETPDQVYDLDKRIDVWTEALAKHKVVVDLSPTGAGKSHSAGLLTTGKLSKAFQKYRMDNQKHQELNQLTFLKTETRTKKEKAFKADKKDNTVKRIVYLSQSPMNVDVATLNTSEWITHQGRNASGWIYDSHISRFRYAYKGESPEVAANCPQAPHINDLRNRRQVTAIKKDICSKCPLAGDCNYLKSINANKSSKYVKMNVESYKPAPTDMVILDDPGSVKFFIEMSITHTDLVLLTDKLQMMPAWKPHYIKVKQFLEYLFEQTRKGLQISRIINAMEQEGILAQYSIQRWLALPEPDKVSIEKIMFTRGGTVEYEEDVQRYKNLKRWFFMLLDLCMSNQAGHLYYEPVSENWYLKGIDPKFRDISSITQGLLVLDSTTNKEQFKYLFGTTPHVVSSGGDPLANVNVIMVEGFQNTYKSVLKCKEASLDPLKEKINFFNDYVVNSPTPVGLITHKALLEDQFKELWDPNAKLGYWFYSERATNLYYEARCKDLFLIGKPIPNVAAVSTELDSYGDIVSVLVARPYVTREDGTKTYILTKEASDPKVRSLMYYKTASAYTQSVGRLRSVQRPDEQFNLFVLEKTALPFKVNQVITVNNKPEKIIAFDMNHLVDKKLEYHKNSLVKFIRSTSAKYDGKLTMDALKYIDSNLSAALLHRLEVKLGSCGSYQEMEDRIIKAMDRERKGVETKAYMIPESDDVVEGLTPLRILV